MLVILDHKGGTKIVLPDTGSALTSLSLTPKPRIWITTSPRQPADWRRTPTVRQIFGGFLGLGLISFGGALPLARRALVEQRRWLSADEFTDLLGLCQFLPGGNVINLSVAMGMRFRGVPGALAGLLGLIAGPSLVVIGLGVLYEHTQNDPHVRHLFAGLAAAAAGPADLDGRENRAAAAAQADGRADRGARLHRHRDPALAAIAHHAGADAAQHLHRVEERR